MSNSARTPRLAGVIVAAATLFTLAGCSGREATVAVAHPLSAGITGSVHGGQQPVVGASVQLYAVGTGGDKTAATPLMASAVTTDGNGSFSLGSYSCSQATDVYLLATGGNPGAASVNPQIAVMAALGQCSTLSSSTFINMNELTTVAAVATLAPYMSSATSVGSANSDAGALDAAFTLANQMVNYTSGVAGTTTSSGLTVPQALINTLGNVMATCINSTGGAAGDGSACGTLFGLTSLPAHGGVPTDTIASLLNIQNNPGTNVNAIYNLASATGPFQTALSTAPADLKVQPTGTLTLTPAGFDFGKQTAGNAATETLTLTNNGTAAVTLSSASLTGDPFLWQLTDNCGTNLAANSSCAYVVTFRAQVGAYSSTFTVANNSATPSLSTALTGQGQGSSPLVVTGSTTFSSTAVGSSSTNTLTLKNQNPGGSLSTATYITGPNAADFSIGSGSTCTGSISAGASCQLAVVFTPKATGSRTASLDIYDRTYNVDQNFAASGTGAVSALTLSPTSLTYYTYNVYQDVTVTNPNSAAVAVSSVAVTSGYTQTNTCGTSIAANGNCVISVFLGNSSNGTLTLASGAGTQTLSLTGSTQVSYVTAAPTFPTSIAVGSSTSSNITAQAQGQGGKNINGAMQYSITGANAADFTLSGGSTCSTQFAGTCTLPITFTPQGAGTRTARLVVTTANQSGYMGSNQYLTLTGTSK